MAKILYSSLISAISGKFAGSVLTRGSGNLRRLNAGVRNPRTQKQQVARGHFSDLSGAWYALTDTQKGLWDMWAAASKSRGSGMNKFIANNMRLLAADHPSLVRIDSPPPTPATPPAISGFTADEATGANIITWDSPVQADIYIQIYVSVPVGYYCETKPRWKHVGTVLSSLGTFTHSHDYPEDISLAYAALSLDTYGRFSPITARTTITPTTYYTIEVDNSGNPNTHTSYQVKLTIPPGSPAYTGSDPTGGNVRFRDADKTTELSYWIESWDYNGTSIFWIKVPSITASQTKNIYLYHADAGASTTSSGVDTFVLFDDFEDYSIGDGLDLTRWVPEGINAQNFVDIQLDPDDASNQVLRIHEQPDTIQTGTTTIELTKGEYAIRYRFRCSSIAVNYSVVYEVALPLINLALGDSGTPRFKWYNGAAYVDFTPATPTCFINTWYDLELRVTLSTFVLHLDGSDYTGGFRNNPTLGLNTNYIGPLRHTGNTQYYDRYIIRKYSTPDPSATLT